MRRSHPFATPLLMLAAAAVPRADPAAAADAATHARTAETAAVVWNQDDISTANSQNITDFVLANDFGFESATAVVAADVWLSDDEINDNGVLDSFSGTLGWAIYANGAGSRPETLIASGEDSAPTLTDTGLQDDFGADIVRVGIRIDPGVVLQPGLYWLAVHEGAWRSPSDGTVVWWVETASAPEGFSPVGDADERDPTAWDQQDTGGGDVAFRLYGKAAAESAARPIRVRVGPRRAEPVGR